jgi:hypothetical protein
MAVAGVGGAPAPGPGKRTGRDARVVAWPSPEPIMAVSPSLVLDRSGVSGFAPRGPYLVLVAVMAAIVLLGFCPTTRPSPPGSRSPQEAVVVRTVLISSAGKEKASLPQESLV